MRVRKKFLQLTNYTYPHGTEGFLKSYLPKGSNRDEHGNYFYVIGQDPTTMFTCHLDTACSNQVKVKHVFDRDYIKTDGKSILGADDKAGMCVILSLIEKEVPGLYYFFIGEEVGCVGSTRLAKDWASSEFSKTITKVISFDRRGTDSVITHQLFGRCCSDEFATELSNRLNLSGLSFEPDDTGIMTDSAQFIDIVPECTNISVGYYNEHTGKEFQDINFLNKLCSVVTKVDWETLPVVRDPYLDMEEDDEEDPYDIRDTRLEFISQYFSYFKIGGKVKKMFISKTQIRKEKDSIKEWLIRQDYPYETFSWNGNKLLAGGETGDYDFIGTRVELVQFLPELAWVDNKHLSSKVSPKPMIVF